jgi:hypothetical protein
MHALRFELNKRGSKLDQQCLKGEVSNEGHALYSNVVRHLVRHEISCPFDIHHCMFLSQQDDEFKRSGLRR